MQFHCQKTVSSASRCNYSASNIFMMTSYIRPYICSKLAVADLPSDKYTFDCKYVHFVLSLKPLDDMELFIPSLSLSSRGVI